jgi:hypothetical protein
MKIAPGLLLAVSMLAQNATDTPEAHVAIAKAAAGDDYQNLFNFVCARPPLHEEAAVVAQLLEVLPRRRAVRVEARVEARVRPGRRRPGWWPTRWSGRRRSAGCGGHTGSLDLARRTGEGVR